MAEFAETLERIRSEEASIQRLFEGEGRRVRGGSHQAQRNYTRDLTEAATFVMQVQSGRRPMHHLQEAMSTSDFPILFADILDRQLLANYQELPTAWTDFARRGTVANFLRVKRFAVDGAEGVMPRVGELEEYRESALTETADEYSVYKYGRRLDLSWEAMVNDDLDAFRTAPERLARGARRTEERFAAELWLEERGPHRTLFEARYSNIVTGNPALELRGLQLAFRMLYEQRDADGEPIFIDAVTLAYAPALEVTVQNLLNALSIELTNEGGNERQVLRAANWMRGRVRAVAVPYMPIIANRANGSTTWALFANPNSGRPALEMGFLRGFEQPALFERLPNMRRVGGGGGGDIEMAAFEDDSRAWRVTHVLGGARLTATGGTKSVIASNGSGA